MNVAAMCEEALRIALEGQALVASGHALTGIEKFAEALLFEPAVPEILHNLGNALLSLGRADDAIEAAFRAHEAAPDIPALQSNLLTMLLYSPSLIPENVAQAHRQWGAQFAEAWSPPGKRRPGAMRVGYLSSCFRKNPEFFFIEPVLRNHDHNQWEVYGLHTSTCRDAFTDHISALCDKWRDISRVSDEQAAKTIRELELDVLIDCSGHYAESRIRLLGPRLAPVQVSYPTYPATTGLRTVDYRITDVQSDPPGMTDHLHTETLVRLPEIFTCYSPWKHTPEIGPLPLDSNGYITFGSFNRLDKINGKVAHVWASILRQIPGSRLILHSTFHGRIAPPQEHRAWLLNQFSALDIDSARIEFVGGLPLFDYYDVRNRVDIALDTFPFPGLTTTCDSLWMGVPVVSLSGTSHLQRTGAAVLGCAGLSDWVAGTAEEYVNITITNAADVSALRGLRAELRARFRQSAMLDASGFTRQLEHLYRQMSEEACR